MHAHCGDTENIEKKEEKLHNLRTLKESPKKKGVFSCWSPISLPNRGGQPDFPGGRGGQHWDPTVIWAWAMTQSQPFLGAGRVLQE